MKFLTIPKIFVLIVIIILVTFFYFQISNNETDSSENTIESVKRQDLIQRVTLAGNVEPSKKIFITAPFNGHIKKIYVHVGEKVKKNNPLVTVTQSLHSLEDSFPLKVPFDGTVVEIAKSEGEYAREADVKDYILRIDNIDTFFVNSSVPEIDIVKIKKGQEVIVKVNAILNKTYNGVVEEISLAAKGQDEWRGNSKVEYKAKIRIFNSDSLIHSGMSAVVDIVTLKKTSVLVLPHEYILKENDNYYVYLKNGDKKNIKVGFQNETHFEIIEGLKENDDVKLINFMDILKSGKK